MDRLRLAFEDVRDTVGEKLLPIIEKVVNFFLNDAGPAVDGIRSKFEPLTNALKDNKDEFTAIWNFLNKYIVPILTGALKGAVNGLVTTFTTLVNIVGKAVNFFQDLYAAYKKIVDFIKNNPLTNLLGKLNPFSNSSFGGADFSIGGGANGVDELGRPVVVNAGGGGGGGGGGGASSSPRGGTLDGAKVYTVNGRKILVPAGLDEDQAQAYAERIAKSADRTDELIAETAIIREGIAARKAGNTGVTDGGSQAIVVNVNAPSAIDEEGFTRAVVSALNQTQARTGGGGSQLVL
jgi:hypothetical protein